MATKTPHRPRRRSFKDTLSDPATRREILQAARVSRPKAKPSDLPYGARITRQGTVQIREQWREDGIGIMRIAKGPWIDLGPAINFYTKN